MTFAQLECFSALAERLNFTQTANDLFMAQTTLSRSISTLEQELGVQLFHRNSRGVELTPAGLAFRVECKKMLEDYQHAITAARHAERGFHGELTIGVLQDNFDPVAIRIFRAMAAYYPDVCLTLQEYNHSQLISNFQHGALDVIIDFGSFHLPSEQNMVLLHENQQCVVVSSDCSLAKRTQVRVEELQDFPFVTMSQSVSQPGHDFLWQTAAKAGFVPKIAAEAKHIPTLLMMVACGLGITFLMDDVPNPAKDFIHFIPLENVEPSIQGLLWMRENQNPSLPLLIDVVQKIHCHQL